jgi:hypothetical protein
MQPALSIWPGPIKGISPLKYSEIVVLGVLPVLPIPKSPNLTQTQFSGNLKKVSSSLI